MTPFDPVSGEGWVEGSAAQYTWMVPHALGALSDALGGAAEATARLDDFFTYLNADESPFARLGDEPSANTPWIYDWLGRPDRTQEVVRRKLLTLFDDTPSGYPGNDDVGQTAAWYVFAALGFYPAIPGTDVLAIGSPLFPEAAIRLANGTLVITGRDAAPDRPYVKQFTAKGREHTRPWIRFDEVRNGGEIAFDLVASPNSQWGRAPDSAPPSFGQGYRDVCAAVTP